MDLNNRKFDLKQRENSGLFSQTKNDLIKRAVKLIKVKLNYIKGRLHDWSKNCRNAEDTFWVYDVY